MAMGSSCAIFFFYKYIVAKHKRGKKKSHIFEETWSVLRGHKEAKMILLGCGGLAVPCQARAPDLQGTLGLEGQLGCCTPSEVTGLERKAGDLAVTEGLC